MKLLLENWREYLNEMEEEVIDTLRIFDFDETIAHTRSSTRVTAPDGSKAVLNNQQEFEAYMTAANTISIMKTAAAGPATKGPTTSSISGVI